MLPARHAAIYLLACAGTLSLARAQCTTHPGHTLTTDSLFSIGEMLAVEVTAPAGAQGFLLMSPNPGPTSTFFGDLCIGSGFGVALQFVGTGQPQRIQFCDLPCDPGFVGLEAFLSFIAFQMNPMLTWGLSNGVSVQITDQLGLAQQFEVFGRTDVSLQYGAVGGRIAAGDDIALVNYQVGSQLPNSGGTRDDAVAFDDVILTGVTILNGNGTWGDGNNNSIVNSQAPNGQFMQRTPGFSMTEEFDFLKRRVAAFAAVADNGVAQVSGQSLLLVGTDPDLNVFSVPGTDLSVASDVQVMVPPGSTTLINISGKIFSVNADLQVSGAQPCSVVWNFHEATWLRFLRVEVEGVILAPCASMWFNDSNLTGSIVASYIDGANHTISMAPFCGCIQLF